MTTLAKLEKKVADTKAAYRRTRIAIDYSVATSTDAHLIRVSHAVLEKRNDLISKWGTAQDNMLAAETELKLFLKKVHK
jgi:hypothetical protein